MGIKIEGKIEKVNGLELSYDDFVKRYMEKNQPVVLTGLTDQWRACTDWVTSNGKPNLQFFATHFPKSTVQVADCGTREFTDQKRVQMSVSKFVDQWVQGSVQEEDSNASTKDVRDKPLLYLKDWHLVKVYKAFFLLLFSPWFAAPMSWVQLFMGGTYLGIF
uniref:Uncharacterized protein n=1 Tax=Cannabis sativa TaxID=3483 RepID=A0A803QNQ3_CANSA